jgi:hypothetical protein
VMGTISDKLMRIINTKEDIRQALISKGYDVPTSIPFKEYAKMISDLPCSVDSFPDIEGIVARYSALGLTNEQMAENPVWRDLTGNGHDLQMKNFAWGGMSGVGGYVGDFSRWVNNRDTTEIGITKSNLKVIIDVKVSQGSGKNIVYISKSNLGISNNITIKITSTYPEGVMKFANSASNKYLKLPSNGIITLQDNSEYTSDKMYLHLASADLGQITIEQLPLYPGFILGDGVDNFAVTEKELNFEDTYTVYTAFIPFQSNPTRNMVLCGADSKKTFTMQYSSLVYVSFIVGNSIYINANFVNGLNLFACKRNGNNICIKNLLTNKVVTGTCGDWVENAGLYYLWKNATYASFAKAAIAGQTICNGYFSTDEDDEKVLDWYKKQYPWLFPDQAWTVVGKTNEDKDRATIANITGNGNDLILSNFGFAEGSGYGLYAENYAGGRWVQSTDRADLTWTSYSVNITSVKVASTQLYYQSYPEQPSFIVPSYKIKVYGLKDGQTLSYKQVTSEGQQIYKISEDGIYTLPSFLFKANGDWYGFTLDKIQETCDITIEQIPEYEGYLVTDGVDDKAVSKQFKFGENFTVILDFKFPVKKISYCGFDLSSKVRIQNLQGSGVYVVLKGNKTLIPSNVVRAVTSEGKVYDENWNEYNIVPGNISSNYTMVNLGFDGSNQFAESATKLAGIYSSILSKDECIKAYNYLQTLKSK